MRDATRWSNWIFGAAFGLLALLASWWTVLIGRLINENYHLRLAVEGAAAAQEELHRQRLMLFGETSLLMVLAITLVFWAFRSAQRERAQIRRLEGMLAASTHELKTPVASVRALLETIQSGVLPPERMGPYLARGVESCDRLEHLIEGILAYQASLAKPAPMVAQPLEDWVASVLTHRQEGESQLEVALGASAEVRVFAGEDTFRVVLENLLDNARKYGGDTPVQISAQREGGGVWLAVTDRGLGFPPEEAEALFEPYVRGSAGRKQHGTGLGLYISRVLVRRMGGDLLAESAGPGTGATFRFRLRVAEDG